VAVSVIATTWRDGAWRLAGQAIQRGGTFLAMILAARFLGTEGLGQFSLILVAMAHLYVVAEWGQQLAITREAARRPQAASSLLSAAFLINATGGAVAALLFWLAAYFIAPDNSSMLAAGFFGVAILIQVALSGLRGLFGARGAWRLEAGVAAVERGTMLAAALIALSSGKGLAGLGYSFAIGQALVVGIVLFGVRRLIGARPPMRINAESKPLLRSGLWLMLAALAAIIYVRGDVLILGAYHSAAEVGGYAAAFNLILALGFLPQAYLHVQLPRLAAAGAGACNEWLKRAAWKLAAAAAVGGVGIIALGGPLFDLLYGRRDGLFILPWLVAAEVFNFFNYAGGVARRAAGDERFLAQLMGVAALANLALNFALVPRWGAMGAAFSTLLTYAAVSAGHFWRLGGGSFRSVVYAGAAAFVIGAWSVYGWRL